MKKIALLFLALTSTFVSAQIRGTVIDSENEPLPSVSIYLENTIAGTTTNDSGEYELSIKATGDYTVLFQFLGFKTVKKEISIKKLPYILNVKMTEEQIVLGEVQISSKENLANKIIQSAIASKKKNQEKLKKFTADFYSRGLYKIKNAPKTILGQEIGDLGGGLDSTRSGIIYLSETVSKISYERPSNFKEHIVASKVSGSDNGVSFNRAEDVNFNLYENTINFGAEVISPLANYAFGYYDYKLSGTFYDKLGNLINKIELIPKRENDRVFKGFIYIVEDDWAIYGSDISITGTQINLPMVDVLHFQQEYNFAASNNVWVVISQIIDFKIGLFGFKIDGRFTSAYTNYNFAPIFDATTFGKEILSFAKKATEKDSLYWKALRPVPLTKEEVTDYSVKDSIKIIRKSKVYLDSLDRKNNKPKFGNLISGYSFQNSYKNWSLSLSSPLTDLNFNTVKGWNSSIGLSYFNLLNEQGNWFRLSTNFNYGFSDKRLRPTVSFTYKWDNLTRPILSFSAGVETPQYNGKNPISAFLNTISSTYFERNYLKIYEKTFANIGFSKELSSGIRFQTSLEYADRKPLINTTDYSTRNVENVSYSSNDPQNPTNFTPAFTPHHLWTWSIGSTINFGTKYLSYPDSKITVYNDSYPSLYLGYRKTFGSGNESLHSDFIFGQATQSFSMGNLGGFSYRLKGGLFLEQKNISFIDYAHFNGNKLAVSPSSNPLDHFNLLDYYAYSTNDKFAEFHGEHNFKGFILNKIPLVSLLNFHLVVGAKGLLTGGQKPYSEASVGLSNIGWGKWRFLRVDYVISKGGINQKQHGFVFGLSLFN